MTLAVSHFRPCLHGRQVWLRTNRANPKWLQQRAEPYNKVTRLLRTLAEFDCNIEHPGGIYTGMLIDWGANAGNASNAIGLRREMEDPPSTEWSGLTTDMLRMNSWSRDHMERQPESLAVKDIAGKLPLLESEAYKTAPSQSLTMCYLFVTVDTLQVLGIQQKAQPSETFGN